MYWKELYKKEWSSSRHNHNCSKLWIVPRQIYKKRKMKKSSSKNSWKSSRKRRFNSSLISEPRKLRLRPRDRNTIRMLFQKNQQNKIVLTHKHTSHVIHLLLIVLDNTVDMMRLEMKTQLDQITVFCLSWLYRKNINARDWNYLISWINYSMKMFVLGRDLHLPRLNWLN